MTDGMVDFCIVIRECLRAEDVISVQAIRKVVIGEVCPIRIQHHVLHTRTASLAPYPESIISSSMPYSFIC